jgi:serine/threonine protein kinase/DNA-binding winged helix-turn-helix (wHTH) protein
MATPGGSFEQARTSLSRWRFANVEFDERSFELWVGGVSVDVERAPLRVLRELLEQPGQLLSREQLLAAVWKRKPDTISRNALTNAIGKLRRAIGDDAQQIVVSAAGEGYRLAADVERRMLPPLQSLDQILKIGQPAPHRPNWALRERIATTDSSEVWKAEHIKTREQRVFKYAGDGFQLAALRREVTISRLLSEALGPRPEFVRVHDWSFEQPPYFIESEYAGEDLGRWAEAQGGLLKLPLQQRLQLIAELADALALAHSVGALHKDLKPGNVLIETRGQSLQVKVADFGSGRLLDPELLDQYHITRLALPEAETKSGTPFYLAPELFAGQPSTVRADLYSLGVMLYQIVVGDFSRALLPGWEREIDDDLLCEDIADAAQGDPQRRLADAAVLAERLRQLPQRREQRRQQIKARESADLAARALERYKARRTGFVTAIAVLVLGLGVSLKLYFDASAAQIRAEAEKKKALQAAAEADAASQFLIADVFSGISPRKDFRIRDLLDIIDRSIDSRFAGEPLLAAKVRGKLSNTYEGLGDLQGSRRLDAELWAQICRAVDRHSSDALPLALLWAQGGGGRVFASGIPYWQQLSAQAAETFGPNAAETLTLQQRLGTNYLEVGDYARALTQETAAVDTLKRLRPNQLPTVWALNRLAIIRNQLGDFAGAEANAREALAVAQRAKTDTIEPTFFPRSLLAEIETETGRYAQADAELTALLPELRRFRDENNPLVNTSLLRLGLLRLRQGRDQDAEALIAQARGNLETGFGVDDIDAMSRYAPAAAALYLAEHRLDEAEHLIRRAEQVYAALYPSEHLDISLLKITLAEVLLEKGQIAQAKKLLADYAPERRAYLESVDLFHARLSRVEGLIDVAEARRDEALAKLSLSLALFRRTGDGEGYWSERTSADLSRVQGSASTAPKNAAFVKLRSP